MRKWIFKCLILIVGLGCNSKGPHLKEIHSIHKEFKDFITIDDKIFALDLENKLVQINPTAEGYRIVATQVQAFGPMQSSEIIVVTQSGEIKSYDFKKAVWTKRGTTTVEVKGIIPVDKNVYLWTDSGIIDYRTGKLYENDSSYNSQIKDSGLPPNAIAVDSDKNIWLSFNFGEWGGDLVVFSTQEEQYLHPKLKNYDFNLLAIQDILVSKEAVYLMPEGYSLQLAPILEVENLSSRVLFQPKEKKEKVISEDGGEGYSIKRPFAISAGAIDNQKNKIYVGTFENKIWEGDLSMDLSKEINWKEIANITDYQNQNDTDSKEFPVIDNVSIIKLENMKNKGFAFLPFEGGIGYLKKDQLKVFK
jgi:hypothetical protein